MRNKRGRKTNEEEDTGDDETWEQQEKTKPSPAFKLCLNSVKKRDNWDNLGIDRKIILKYALRP